MGLQWGAEGELGLQRPISWTKMGQVFPSYLSHGRAVSRGWSHKVRNTESGELWALGEESRASWISLEGRSEEQR